MKKRNLNGLIFSTEKTQVEVSNRAFRYGDGVFETMVMINGQLRNWSYHFERMKKSWDALEMEYPSTYTEPQLWLNQFTQLLDNQSTAKIRWQVFRDTGGLYTPTNNRFSYLIEIFPFTDKKHEPVLLGLYDKTFILANNWLSNLKTCNALPYVLAGHFAKKEGFDDCILLNQYGRIAETISSNIFIYLGKKWCTPPLSEGCVAGTMRASILDNFVEQKIRFSERPLTLENLKNAQAIFLTNAVSGLRWVKEFDGVHYKTKIY